MNTAIINIKTEPALKEKAQKLAQEMGVSLSSVINHYLKQFVTAKTITFKSEAEEPSAYLLRDMRRAKENRKKKKHSPKFKTGEEAIKWLEKQGI